MKLATENYKGISITAVQKVIGGKKVVEGCAMCKGRKLHAIAPTKEQVLPKVKAKIDTMLK